jgi:hypothetical protein
VTETTRERNSLVLIEGYGVSILNVELITKAVF